MKTLIGGAIAFVLGVIGIVAWWKPFLTVLAGSLPVMFLLGGALAIYLGFDELKDTWKKEEPEEAAEAPSEGEEDVEKYKKEIDELKEEIEDLKKE
ncbi:MAG: hypothetical protein PVF56_03480 [Desulfobacterales bacterium]|jgi:phosphate/sulfate permease